MTFTYRLKEDGIGTDFTEIAGRDEVKEWLRIAVMTPRGSQPYLRDKYGIDLIQIARGTDPAYYLEESIKEICSLRDGVWLTSCRCWEDRETRSLFAEIHCETSYGDITLENVRTAAYAGGE